ncbi:hypothetical protein LSAT2_025321, partial [Lamellibrachia satsuma]
SPDSGSAPEEDSSGMSEDEANCNAVVLHHFDPKQLRDWQLVMLWEHLCSLYIPENQSSLRDQVFKLLYMEQKNMKFTIPLTNLNDVTSIRRQSSVYFTAFVKNVLKGT